MLNLESLWLSLHNAKNRTFLASKLQKLTILVTRYIDRWSIIDPLIVCENACKNYCYFHHFSRLTTQWMTKLFLSPQWWITFTSSILSPHVFLRLSVRKSKYVKNFSFLMKARQTYRRTNQQTDNLKFISFANFWNKISKVNNNNMK